MAEAIAIVIEQRVLRRQSALFLIKRGRHASRVVKGFSHRDAAIFVRISFALAQSVHEIFGETGGILFAPTAGCCDDDCSSRRKRFDEFAACTGHVYDYDSLRRDSFHKKGEFASGQVRTYQIELGFLVVEAPRSSG